MRMYFTTGRVLAGMAVCAVTLALFAGEAGAQPMINVGAPAHTAGHSFYESIGVRWGLRGNGWFFNFGGAPPPVFGGFDPNAQANFGFGGPNGFFNVTAGQGSSRTLTSASPSVTVMNGGFGFFSDTVQRPFVTAVVPVVGAGDDSDEPLPPLSFPPPPPQVSSAERGDLSVNAIKARRAQEKAEEAAAMQAEVEVLLEKARGAQAEGKPGVAKVYLQMAARRATGKQQAEIVKQIEATAP